MGYTHYWNVSDEPQGAFQRLSLDAKQIFNAAPSLLIELADAMGTEETKPELSEGEIVFNGKAPDDYETFYFAGTDRGFQFCKTARMPYDPIVGAVLIRAKVHYGNAISVTSDGDWVEWDEAATICKDLFGTVDCPFSEEDS